MTTFFLRRMSRKELGEKTPNDPHTPKGQYTGSSLFESLPTLKRVQSMSIEDFTCKVGYMFWSVSQAVTVRFNHLVTLINVFSPGEQNGQKNIHNSNQPTLKLSPSP